MGRQLVEPTGNLNIVAFEDSSPNDFDFFGRGMEDSQSKAELEIE